MGEAWHDGVSEEALKSEADREYGRAEKVIREGLARGLGFAAACAGIDVKDQHLRDAIIDDMLKVVIAEEHFAKGISLEDLAGRLKLDVQRLEAAKEAMLKEVEDAAVREYHGGLSDRSDGQTFH